MSRVLMNLLTFPVLVFRVVRLLSLMLLNDLSLTHADFVAATSGKRVAR